MPVPYEDALDVEDLGIAAFLRIERGRTTTERLGAILFINTLGEPLEFVYNRIEIPHPFLWRVSDLEHHAARQLTTSLLTACSTVPRLLLCLADEVGEALFGQHIRVSIPVGRIVSNAGALLDAEAPDAEPQDKDARGTISWFPSVPAAASPERQLFERLLKGGLLVEPFARASTGLREVYPAQPSNV